MNHGTGATRASVARPVLLLGLRSVDEHGRRGRPGIAWRSGRLHSPSGLRTANLRMELADHLAFAGSTNGERPISTSDPAPTRKHPKVC